MRTKTNDLLKREVAKWCVILAALFLVAGAALAVQIIPPVSSPTTNTYAKLGAEWWQWALQAPNTDSPLFGNYSGLKCRGGQRGQVWFLAGTLGSGDPATPTVRQCEVPVGKAIFFPVINLGFFAFLSDPPEQRTANFLRTYLQNNCDSANAVLSVKIDGIAVSNPNKYFTTPAQSPIFQVQLPTDAIYGLTADVIPALMFSPAAHKGFYLYLNPLSPGSHTIEWTASWDCGSENVRYELNVLNGVTGEVP
jgi:hypothetical protein